MEDNIKFDKMLVKNIIFFIVLFVEGKNFF